MADPHRNCSSMPQVLVSDGSLISHTNISQYNVLYIQKAFEKCVKLLISAYFTGELTQRDPQKVREEGP